MKRGHLLAVLPLLATGVFGARSAKGALALKVGDAIDRAQTSLMADGTLPALIKQWLGNGAIVPR